MIAPVSSPIAATTRRACSTSALVRLNTCLAMSIWTGCRLQAPMQPSRNALRNCPRTPGCPRCRRTGRSTGRCRWPRRRRPAGGSCGARRPAGRCVARRVARRVGRRVVGDRVLPDQVAGVPPTHLGGLHPTVGCQVGRSQTEALQSRAGRADLPHPGHPGSGLQDGVHQDRLAQTGLRLQLSRQSVHVVEILGAFHLRDHHDVQGFAGLQNGRCQVIQIPGAVQRVHPGGVQRVHPGPQLGLPGGPGVADVHQPGAGGLHVRCRHAVPEVRRKHVHGRGDLGDLRDQCGVAGQEEVDHPGRAGRDFPQRSGRADGR